MRVMLYWGMVLYCCYLSANVLAVVNTPDVMICVPENIIVCESDKKACNDIPVVDVDGPYSVKVDLKSKKTETFAGSQKVSAGKIDHIEHVDQLLFLSSYQKEHRGKKFPHSWNAVIDLQTGKLTFTSVANGVGFMLNGSCSQSKGGKP